MYLAQFYDDAVSASRHPSIAIDSGFMMVTQGAYTHEPVGDTGRRFLQATSYSTHEQGIMRLVLDSIARSRTSAASFCKATSSRNCRHC